MAHVSKFAKSAIGHMTKHYERAKDENDNYIKFGNQEIDTSKTHLNYNLDSKKDISQIEFIQKRCSEVQCLNRKDVKVMCTWVITSPKTIQNQSDEKKFFEESYKFLSQKYGSENIISAYVHKDESQPHMHFSFIPVVEDKKRGNLKVSAKECLSKNHLQTFHSELDNHMKNAFGHDIGILNEATKEGNKEIQELKQATLLSKTQTLEDDIELLQKEKQALETKIEGSKLDLNLQQDELERTKQIIDIMDKTAHQIRITTSFSVGNKFQNDSCIERKEIGLFKKEAIISMPEKEWEQFKHAYQSLENLDKLYDQFRRQIVAIFDVFKTDNIETLKKQIGNLQHNKEILQKDNRFLKMEVSKLKEDDKKTTKLINKTLDKITKDTNTNFKKLFIEEYNQIQKQQSHHFELER